MATMKYSERVGIFRVKNLLTTIVLYYLPRVIYIYDRVRNRKIILKLPPFWILNKEFQRAENSNENNNRNIIIQVFKLAMCLLQKFFFFTELTILLSMIIYVVICYLVVLYFCYFAFIVFIMLLWPCLSSTSGG